MEKEVKIGAETELRIEAVNQKLRLSVAYEGVDLTAGSFVECTVDQLCNALAKAIPGDTSMEKLGIQGLRMGLNAAMG